MMRYIFLTLALTLLFAKSGPGQANDNHCTLIESNVYSSILNENRKLLISLPDNYATSNESYPVIFILDASKNYNVTLETLKYLEGYHFIPKVIAIGLINSNRDRDMTHTKNELAYIGSSFGGGGKKFQAFIKSELIPFLDKNYRTSPFRVLIGHSLGGLFAYNVFLSDPDLFYAYFSISPSLWWNNEECIDLTRSMVSHYKELPNYVFISFGDGEGDFVDPVLENMDSIFEAAGLNKFTYILKRFPGENHVTTYVSDVNYALNDLFLKDWSIRSLHRGIQDGGLQFIIDHYEGLEKKYGLKVDIPQHLLTSSIIMLLERSEYEKAIEIGKYNISVNPEYPEPYHVLGDVYKLQGNSEKAEKYHDLSLALDAEKDDRRKQTE